MAVIFRANGQVEFVQPANGRDFKLKEMQDIVGGYIEIHPLRGFIAVMDEEGKLKDKPVNAAASLMWYADYGPTDTIVGDVLVCDDSEVL